VDTQREERKGQCCSEKKSKLYVKRLQQKDHKDIAPYLVNLSLGLSIHAEFSSPILSMAVKMTNQK
jgi:hypothetical protein